MSAVSNRHFTGSLSHVIMWSSGSVYLKNPAQIPGSDPRMTGGVLGEFLFFFCIQGMSISSRFLIQESLESTFPNPINSTQSNGFKLATFNVFQDGQRMYLQDLRNLFGCVYFFSQCVFIFILVWVCFI